MTKRTIACVTLILPLYCGCSAEPPQTQNQINEQQTKPADNSFSHVITTETEYYTTGPQQGRPPDGKFPAATKVNIVQQAGSYTQVRSENEIEAYVASDAVEETEP